MGRTHGGIVHGFQDVTRATNRWHVKKMTTGGERGSVSICTCNTLTLHSKETRSDSHVVVRDGVRSRFQRQSAPSSLFVRRKDPSPVEIRLFVRFLVVIELRIVQALRPIVPDPVQRARTRM